MNILYEHVAELQLNASKYVQTLGGIVPSKLIEIKKNDNIEQVDKGEKKNEIKNNDINTREKWGIIQTKGIRLILGWSCAIEMAREIIEL